MLKEIIKLVEKDIPLVWDACKVPPTADKYTTGNFSNNQQSTFKVKEEEQEEQEDINTDDMVDLDMNEDEVDPSDDDPLGDEADDGTSDIQDDNTTDEVEGDEIGIEDEDQDPDRQGLIRTVPGAHLVYKRVTDDGTFDELWIYNTGGEFDKELDTRRAILAGTDIPMNKMKSKDGSQSYTLWNAGNGQLLHITGLPS